MELVMTGQTVGVCDPDEETMRTMRAMRGSRYDADVNVVSIPKPTAQDADRECIGDDCIACVLRDLGWQN